MQADKADAPGRTFTHAGEFMLAAAVDGGHLFTFIVSYSPQRKVNARSVPGNPLLHEAKSSEASGRILRIKSLDNLKTRLGKVILIILIVETFKVAFEIKADSPLDLLYVAAAIALIGLALYPTRGSGSERKNEPTLHDESQNNQ
jgi:Uncharacterized protein family, UPF0114